MILSNGPYNSFRFVFLLFLINLLYNPVFALDLYVSPDGNDAWTGRLKTADRTADDGPLATLSGARDTIRKIKAKGPLTEPVCVTIADGNYIMTEPFVLTPQDSGTAEFPVTYQSAPESNPTFTGGKAITGFKEDKDGIWSVDIPEVKQGKWYFEQLFVNGSRAVRARTPDEFYHYMGQTTEEPLANDPETFKRTTIVQPDSLKLLENLSADEISDVTLVAYHKWCITRRFLTAVDYASNSIITTGEKLKSYSPWPINTRFHLENFQAALDIPGEWFLSRTGTLYYKPLPDQDMSKAHVIAPVIEKFIIFQGDPQTGKFVEHIKLKGLSFQHNQSLLPKTGYYPFQAAFVTEAAIMADGARNIEISDCNVSHTANYGIWFRTGCKNCTTRKCYLYDLGAGGIRIGEGQIRPDENLRTSRITVDNNIIHAGGRIYTSAVGIWVGQSGDNTITHNDISDLFYTGLSIGWRWGYAESLAKRNTISFNKVHHIGQGVLSDMGGIYTLGPSEGTIVTNNVFHDIYAYSYGGWGLYTDEGSTGILMENNLIYNVKTGCFHQHYGKENIIRNNIFAFSELYQIQATRIEDHLSFTLENNIVYYNKGVLLSGPWDRIKANVRNNLYWDCTGKKVDFLGSELAAWQKKTGKDSGSIIADPKFTDPEKFDFRLKDNSPAKDIGFKPFDYSQAGVYGDPQWIKLAADAPMPKLQIPPPPPSDK